MPLQSKITPYSNRGQCVFLVLFALRALGGSNSKEAVIGHIRGGGWYDVTRHDLPPYLGQNESRYHTLLAWARKDCHERGWLIQTDEQNDWAISREGRSILENAIGRFEQNEWKVSECYLWKSCFKKLIDPAFEPSPADKVRPVARGRGPKYY